MPSAIDSREAIVTALKAFGGASVRDAAETLFAALGYASDRRIPIATPKEFCAQLDPGNKLTDRERMTLNELLSLHLLFQLTGSEFGSSMDLFDGSAVQATKIESYLFFAADLPPGQYPRAVLSSLVRAVNKPLPMPALVLFRHGDTVSLGIIHRRLHKRDDAKDVLEKVTLIKDIAIADPIRAHIEILNDFALVNLDAEYGASNFARLHEAWQHRLGSYALSNDFYREIADWYFWAHHQIEDGTIRLPLHCDTEQEQSLFLIRLLTRVIFCWFLVEKRLIPAELFRVHRLVSLLKDFKFTRDPKKPDDASSYYHAILQNLFFGTLNIPSEQRAFREKKKAGDRYDKSYGITTLWRYEADFHKPDEWRALCKRVPFLNGGLFECLDDKSGKKKDNFILDGFSDSADFGCDLPNDLFFGYERSVDLSPDYGEENKHLARSKKAKVRGLIEILFRYKFTIEENTPLDEEIALDPELLGKVFENLLASYNEDTRTTARKALGAYYTPRAIVGFMVDEALKSYLATRVARSKAALEDLFSNKATLKEVKPDVRDALITAIGRVKILDPACGSGAFPMGALHRLVDLLQKLDPNNESWKRDRLAEARRYRQLLEEAGGGEEEILACDARIADIQRSFDTRFHALDFARKLYLIENCIYGVDIQPIATQIAKLRFFISLVVDQKMDAEADNLGVRPLPNLETRLVAADALIPIEKAESDLFSGEIDRARAELAAIRHEHFNARNPAAKRKWRDADADKRHEIATLLEREHTIPRAGARMLAAWDPYDQNVFAPFFDSEWMFGLPVGKVRTRDRGRVTVLGNLALINEVRGQTEFVADAARERDSGFDIVIGNPPYGAFLAEAQKDQLKIIYAHIVQRIRNTFLYFLGAGFNLIRNGGVVSYIIPNEFLFQIYMTKARGYFLSKARYLLVVNLGEDAFKAIVPTAIVSIQKSEVPEYDIPVADLRGCKLEDLPERLNIRHFSKVSTRVVHATPNQMFSFDSRNAELVNALTSRFSKFEEFCDDVANGISTSCDAVYIVSSQHAKDEHFERHYVKPCIRGGQFRRFWCPPRTGDELLYVTSAFEPSKGKHILKYLSGHRDLLVRKSVEKKAGNREWHLLFRPRYESLFAAPKIMIRQTGDHVVAAIDRDTGFYCIDSVNVALVKREFHDRLEYLVGILNSAVVDFYYREISQEAGRALAQVKPQRLRALPVPNATDAQRSLITEVVRLIATATVALEMPDAPTSRDPLMLAYLQRVLNGLVYELYFPDDMRGAGLRLFDVVAQAKLPNVSGIPDGGRLAALRQVFEALYDGVHPLRIALDKIQTLDTVRVIERTP
jgi:adenine-specific DNA-methyltransferase